MKIAIMIGTRPEIIKMAPVIRYCEGKNMDYFVIHSGQHYSYAMDKIFFEELNLPEPKYMLRIKSSAPWKQGEHTGKILIKTEDILLKENPDFIIVHGDTNTTLAGALIAAKITTTKEYTNRRITIAHVESGMRSYDRSMPEEINRVIVDHLSNILYPPTENAKKNLIKEGLQDRKIVVTGNTIVDAVNQNLELAGKKKDMLKELGLEKDGYILVTVHRQETVDVEGRLKNIINAFERIYKETKKIIVYPLHPRTKKMIEKFKIKIPECIKIIEPVGFLEFLQLESNARLILTDSGGVQEESCILKVPCVTLRNSTERPETVEAGSNMIAGYDAEKIVEASRKMLDKKRDWKNPFGDGNAAKKIIENLK